MKDHKNDNSEHEGVEHGESFASSQLGSHLSANQSLATDETIKGMSGFLQEAARRNKSLADDQLRKKAQGYLFEAIEVTKFNREAASAGSSYRAVLTSATKGRGTESVDIEIRLGNKVVKRIQAKSAKSAAESLHQITQEKYRGMDKLVPKEQADKAKELAAKRASSGTIKSEDYKDSAKKITGETKTGNVGSGGTTYNESMDAAKNPKNYAIKMEMKALGKEAWTSGSQAAVAGAVISGGISTIKNTIKYAKGDLLGEEALQEIAKDAGKSAVKSGATGVGGSVVRYAGKKAGSQVLVKSNIATAIATSIVESGVTIIQFAEGKITAEEAVDQLGQNGISTTNGIFTGAAAGAIFGPLGAVVGSMAGFIAASSIYQSCLSVLKNANLAEKQAERIEALCDASIKELEQQKKDFEYQLNMKIINKGNEFNKLLSCLDLAYNGSDYIATFDALSDLSLFFGKQLKFKTLEQFDDFMENSDQPLEI